MRGLDSYSTATVGFEPRRLGLRVGTVYEFQVVVSARAGNSSDVHTRFAKRHRSIACACMWCCT